MPVRFKDRPSPMSTFNVLEFKLALDHYVVVGEPATGHVAKTLHWLPSQSRTVPCLDEDCPWHHLPIREAVYCPCLYQAGRLWKTGIMTLTLKMQRFLECDYRGKIYKFARKDCYNGPVVWAYQEHMRPCAIPVPPIDVIPSLLRMWGEFSNYKIRTAADQAAAAELPRLMNLEGGAA